MQAESCWFYLCYSTRSPKLFFQSILIFQCPMKYLFKDEKHQSGFFHSYKKNFPHFPLFFFFFYIWICLFERMSLGQTNLQSHIKTKGKGTASGYILQIKICHDRTKSPIPRLMLNIPVTTGSTGTAIVSFISLGLRNLCLHLWFSGLTARVKRIARFIA